MEDHTKYLSRVDKKKVNDTSEYSDWTSKKWIWILDEDTKIVFSKANILSDSGDSYEVKIHETNATKIVNKNNTFKMNPPKFDKVEDMAELAYLNEPSVIENLRQRYHSDMIYTYSGLFCVAINPYKLLPIYTPQVMDMYKCARRDSVPPHVYHIADAAYRNMLQHRENQSILVTGESGAGKTENTKKVIQYITKIASGESSSQVKLEDQLLQCNPILEAFGNAKTTKNDNSSRFGKFIKIEFDRSGVITGGYILTYLLEKSRAVRQATGERNFHIFYQLTQSLNSEMKSQLLLDGLESVKWISDKGASVLNSINDKKDFVDTIKAMNVIGITPEEQMDIWTILSGIIKMSQLEFTQNRQDQAQMMDDSIANMICKLYNISLIELTKAMLKPRMKVGADYVTRAQRKDQVESAIESICKSTYERLFLWIVKKINDALDTRSVKSYFIGILDIAGFEIFQTNGLDQLCINYTNEKLQQFYNHHMFTVEQEEYRREGVPWDFIDFGLDSQPTIELIEGNKNNKISGILDILDDACHLLPRSSEKSFLQKLEEEQSSHSKYGSLSGPKSVKSDIPMFKVQHYAGNVEYTVDNWLIKNQDPLNDNITALFSASSFKLLATLYNDQSSDSASNQRKRGTLRTMSYNYRESLSGLMLTLKETYPHFVRCIIPNHEKKANNLTTLLILDQLRCNGVLEGIRICRQGFPSRITFAEFKQRYELLTPNTIPEGFMDNRNVCELMLEALKTLCDIKPDNYQIGISKVFFRTGVLGQLEEMRDEKISLMIRSIQSHCLAYLARRHYQRLTNFEVAVKRIQMNVRKYLVLRKWPWWFIFNSVRVLIPTKAQDDMNQKVLLLEKEKELLNSENQKIIEEKRVLDDEKNNLKKKIEGLESDISAYSEQIERMTARSQEVLSELEGLENELNEAEEKEKKNLKERLALEDKIEESTSQLEVLKNNLESLLAEKNSLKEKLDGNSSELDREKDLTQRLQKDKSKLELDYEDLNARYSSEQERIKKLEKNTLKVEEALEELGEKLSKAEIAKTKLEGEKKNFSMNLTSALEKINELEAKIAELQEELLKTQNALSKKTEELEEKNQEIVRLKNQNRDLLSNIDDYKEQLKEKTTVVEKYKKELASSEKRIELLNEEMFRGDEDKLTSLKSKTGEIEKLKKEISSLQEQCENTISMTKKQCQEKVNLLEGDLEGIRTQKKEADKQIILLKDANEKLEQSTELTQGNLRVAEKKCRTLQEQIDAFSTQLIEKDNQFKELVNENTKLKTNINRITADLEKKEEELSDLDRQHKESKEKVNELNSKYEDENKEKLQLKNIIRQREDEIISIGEELKDSLASIDEDKKNISGLNNQIGILKSTVAELEETNESSNREKLKVKKILDELQNACDAAERSSKSYKATTDRLQREKDDCEAELIELRNSSSKTIGKVKKLESEMNNIRNDAEKYRTEAENSSRQVGELSAKLFEASKTIENYENDVRKQNSKIKELNNEVDLLKSTGGDVASLKSEIQSLKSSLNERDNELNELNDDLINLEDIKSRQDVEISNLKNKLSQAQKTNDANIEEVKSSLEKKMRELKDQIEDLERAKTLTSSRCAQLQSNLNASLMELDVSEKTKVENIENLKKTEQTLRVTQNELEEFKANSSELNTKIRDLEAKNKNLNSQLANMQFDYEKTEKSRRLAENQHEELSQRSDTLNSQLNVITEKNRRLEQELQTTKRELEQQIEEFENIAMLKSKLQNEVDQLKAAGSILEDNNLNYERKLVELQKKSVETVEQLKTEFDEKSRKSNIQMNQLNSQINNLIFENEELKKQNDEMNRKYKKLDRISKDAKNEAAEHLNKLNDSTATADRLTSKLKSLQRTIDENDGEISSLKSKLRRVQTELSEKEDEVNELGKQLKAKTKTSALTAKRSDSFDS